MNVICAVDIETTGLDPLREEILQLAIVPLDLRNSHKDSAKFANCELRKPLNIRIKALNPERMSGEARKITGLDPRKGLSALDAKKAVSDWLRGNDIDKIIPVGHNYTKFDGPFLRNSQVLNYDEAFSHHELDTLIIARFANLLHESRLQRDKFRTCPALGGKGQTCLLELPSRRLFPSLKLMNLAAELGILSRSGHDSQTGACPKPHDALSDATIAGEIFFKLLELFDFKEGNPWKT